MEPFTITLYMNNGRQAKVDTGSLNSTDAFTLARQMSELPLVHTARLHDNVSDVTADYVMGEAAGLSN